MRDVPHHRLFHNTPSNIFGVACCFFFVVSLLAMSCLLTCLMFLLAVLLTFVAHYLSSSGQVGERPVS
jgi:hypothetical protein